MIRTCRPSAPTLLLACAALCAAGPTMAQTAAATPKTAAGATIENTASASYDTGDGTARTSVASNTVTLKVDELIDVFVDNTDAQPIEGGNGATRRVTTFRVTNTGNGPERFRLASSGALTGDDFDPEDLAIYLDAPGGVVGQYDEGDTLYSPGAGGAQSAADGRYRVAAATIALVKSQKVADPFGGTRPVPGSTVTYSLAAEISGSGSLTGLRLSDTVPTGSSYQPGSITLNGVVKSDAADADEARFENGTVTVSLGTVPAGESRTVTFRVTVD